ncbi:hypothetical protein OF001_U240078 [Pseudomonas sp. OF001]|nr:hypothetical protein OF001_U240078 [Pseudomonas sp. OF001]
MKLAQQPHNKHTQIYLNFSQSKTY